MPRHSLGGLGTPAQLRKRSVNNGLRVAVVCVVLSVVFFTLGNREAGKGPLNSIRGGFQVITTPVKVLGAAVTAPFQGLGNIFANLTSSQETLSELKTRNEKLTARNAELEEAQQTAKRLQKLLDLQDSYNLKSTAARIIAGSTDSWSSTVTIDKGTLAGLAVGMPVTDAAGIIGQTIACGPTSSTVRLLTDEGSSVAAMLQGTRVQGMLNGSADGTLHLTLIGTDQKVEVGDMVVTSGLGGVFPKGLPLGRVYNVNRTTGALYLDIQVSTLSSTENFEEVLVVTSLTEGQEATEEEIAAADKQDSKQVKGVNNSSGSDSSASGSSDSSDGSDNSSSGGE
ncbi:rod shape-determining protein MreC [Atopobium sp. oral taxon 810]|uniref:rod shape-determining protein MreC n=1 Tax=Atopobium sp. oral taxon 810 TaxID=712158 RepID=UPI000396AC72|nr:rod shape-determining protein MreC [Atopobium sp. oral taxon 810]ERI04768.1 rod shape-determining protein MreC [Atopobium sp. oral taxon 810 str. F0209]